MCACSVDSRTPAKPCYKYLCCASSRLCSVCYSQFSTINPLRFAIFAHVMKSKLNAAFNATVHHHQIVEQQYSRGSVEIVDDDNFNILSDNFSQLKDKTKASDYANCATGYQATYLNTNTIESDLIKVNKTIKLINDNQLLKCLNRTMLNNETSSSPLDDQLSQTSNGSANAETNKSSEQLDLVSSPGDTGHSYQQTNFYADHSDSPDNSNSEWSNLHDLDYEQHSNSKKRRIQTRQSTALANQLSSTVQLGDQFNNNQINQLHQLVLAQQQLNALRGQQTNTSSVLSSRLLNQLTKDSSDQDTMSNAVALSSILNGSMNINQLSQHLNQLNQLSQLGLSSSSSLTSLIHNLSSQSNQTPSSKSNQTNSAFNLSLNRQSNSPNIVLNSNVTSNASTNLPFLVSNSNTSGSTVVTSNQPTNSTVTSQSLDSNKKPLELCLVCGDKASG